MSHEFASLSGGVAAISAGTQSASTGTVVFSNSNGISFGMSASSLITASVGVGGSAISYWDNQQLPQSTESVSLNGGVNPAAVFQRILIPNQISATVLKLYAGPAIAIDQAYTLYAAIYTMSGSTISRVSSTSFSSSTNGYLTASISLGTWNITPGEYMMQIAGNAGAGAGVAAVYGVSASFVATSHCFSDALLRSATQASYHLSEFTLAPAARAFLQFAGSF